ncbi:hypothetical protein CENSYa_1309 [Cenarchaeum symbiosum A]|uniref:Uncharacterized protein n=1 Tax=Cenarchaeum symbiosum (strain A) TaxID=414004 RepID=A0RX65_CENSY|nr:hypothetical protein CENSYa_1309 [Cenarchaeum symbiosum A]
MKELDRLKSFRLDSADFSIGDFTMPIKQLNFEELPAPAASGESQAGQNTVHMIVDAEFDKKATDKEITVMQKYIQRITGEVDSFIECRNDKKKTTVKIDGNMMHCKPGERKINFKISISDIMFLE